MFLFLILLGWIPIESTIQGLEYSEPDIQYGNPKSGLPILMYHHVSDPVNGVYGVSTSRLWGDLQQLHDEDFYLVVPSDIENGLTDIPDGKRPVMLTFDDGWLDNFNYITASDGSLEMDPDCVVALLNDFSELHPDFGKGALFFISWDKTPFDQYAHIREKFNYLLDSGYEIGNHTNAHAHFGSLPREQWESAINLPMEKFHNYLGIRTGMIFTLSYPGGYLSRNTGAEELIGSFEFMGVSAIRMGFLVTGSVPEVEDICSSYESWFRVGRLDMSQYSIPRVLSWSNLMQTGTQRESLHDPLRYRMPAQ